MSEKQKKTPTQIADDIVTLYWTLSDMERVSGALFLMIEQAIKAEREEAQALECKHPKCCCVCGHAGKCPECAPINGGVWDMPND
jgi:hypothetical protein